MAEARYADYKWRLISCFVLSLGRNILISICYTKATKDLVQILKSLNFNVMDCFNYLGIKIHRLVLQFYKSLYNNTHLILFEQGSPYYIKISWRFYVVYLYFLKSINHIFQWRSKISTFFLHHACTGMIYTFFQPQCNFFKFLNLWFCYDFQVKDLT